MSEFDTSYVPENNAELSGIVNGLTYMELDIVDPNFSNESVRLLMESDDIEERKELEYKIQQKIQELRAIGVLSSPENLTEVGMSILGSSPEERAGIYNTYKVTFQEKIDSRAKKE